MAEAALRNEKYRIFTMDLTNEELSHIETCRNGILGASAAGTLFGILCGKIALGSSMFAPILVKPLLIATGALTGLIVGSGVAIQQSYSYLKSKPTNLADELRKFSEFKKAIYNPNISDPKDTEIDKKLNDIYNKRMKKLPNTSTSSLDNK